MGYGQLIWDVPKIEGIRKDDFPERKGEVEAVESFLELETVCGKGKYTKVKSLITIGGVERYVYGYTVKKGSHNSPSFNYNEAVKNWGEPGSEDVFFVIATYTDDWDGSPPTRVCNNPPKGTDKLYYYLFRLIKKPKCTSSSITWENLKDCCYRLSRPTPKDNLWTKWK